MAALTPKQEAFCRAYIETSNASEAYRQAYNAGSMKPNTIKKRACELLGNGAVAGTIATLRGKLETSHGVTVASLIAELEEARVVAKEARTAGSMVSATLGKAKLAGLDREPGIEGEGAVPVQVLVTVTDGRVRAEP